MKKASQVKRFYKILVQLQMNKQAMDADIMLFKTNVERYSNFFLEKLSAQLLRVYNDIQVAKEKIFCSGIEDRQALGGGMMRSGNSRFSNFQGSSSKRGGRGFKGGNVGDMSGNYDFMISRDQRNFLGNNNFSNRTDGITDVSGEKIILKFYIYYKN